MPAMLLPLLLVAQLAAADSSWEVPVPGAAGPWAGLTEERIKKMPLSEVLSLLRNEHGLLSEQKQLWDQLNSGGVKLVQARQKLLDALDEAPSAAEPEREEPWTGVSAASIERLRMTELLRLLSRQELLGSGQERVVEDLQAGDMTLGGVRLLLKKRYDAAHNKDVSKANPWGEITIGWLQNKATSLDVLRLLEEREGPPASRCAPTVTLLTDADVLCLAGLMEEARDQERLAEHMEAGMALGEVKKQLVDALQAHLTRKHKKGVIKNMVRPLPLPAPPRRPVLFRASDPH